MPLFVLGFVIACCLLQQATVLPAHPHWGIVLAALLIWIVCRLYQYPWAAKAAALQLGLICGFSVAIWHAERYLQQHLPDAWQGQNITVSGVVANLPKQHPRGQHFQFDVESYTLSEPNLPRRLYLSSYHNEKYPAPILRAGERWQLTVRLKPIHGSQNPHGFDFEYWAMEHQIAASGYLHQKSPQQRVSPLAKDWRYQIQAQREQIRDFFKQVLPDQPYVGVLIALAVGDQDSIPAEQWQIFTRTGINHLISISGLHITLLSSLMFWLSYRAWKQHTRLTLWLPARKAAAVCAFATALAYALLAGFEVPAQRTLYMVGAVTLALWLNRRFSLSQIISLALLAVLLVDPWAVMSPGFWLSFGAVMLILYVSAHRLSAPVLPQEQQFWTKLPSYQQALTEYAHIQWAMTIGLVPLLLALFQQVSLISPIANMVAIPLVSMIIVPLLLIAALLSFSIPLLLAHQLFEWLMHLLLWLNQLPQAVWQQHAPPSWSIALGIIGILVILLPCGFPSRWLGFLMLLPMFLNRPDPIAANSLKLTSFDVGQGQAILLQTAQHALLYDTGPASSNDNNSGNRLLIPSLRAAGISQLDRLILSHNDNDHTGGASAIQQAIPITLQLSSLPANSPLLNPAIPQQRCQRGQSWHWDGVQFDILAPDATFYQQHKIKDNNLSCVLRIQIGQHSILIPGDIEKKTEKWLLQQNSPLQSSLLFIPHHGSKTSSTAEFVAAVAPHYVIINSGYRNPYGHPHPSVLARYQHSQIYRNDHDGALLINIDHNTIDITRWRQYAKRYWHHETQR